MKRYLLVIAACVGLVVFMPGMSCQNGTTNSQAVAFRTLQGVQTAVDKAMKVYGTAVVTGKVTVEKQKQIDDAHFKYREAFRLAVFTAQGNMNTLSPEDVVRLAGELQLLISLL